MVIFAAVGVCLSVCAGNEPRVMFSLSLSVDVLEQCLDIDMELTRHEPESQKELETWCPSSLLLLLSVYRASFPVSVTHAVFVCVCVCQDICEDISDHVEQIHALLETEFSLKLLSYSVNIIVDIRLVQTS